MKQIVEVSFKCDRIVVPHLLKASESLVVVNEIVIGFK